MANGWTPERRARLAEQIGNRKPWERSTGPKSADGKARVSRNAEKGGKRQWLRQLAKAFGRQRGHGLVALLAE
jgi:hypothetical protein